MNPCGVKKNKSLQLNEMHTIDKEEGVGLLSGIL